MVRPLLTLCLVIPLLSCASTPARSLRVVDCTRGEYCGTLHDWPGPSWSQENETLYRNGLGAILREMACGKLSTRGSTLAYVYAGEVDLSGSCEHGRAQFRRVKDRSDGDRLLQAGRIDYLVEFERANPSAVSGGVQVPFSASYYGKAPRAGADPRLEAVDTYLIVRTDKTAEVRLISRASL